MGFLATDFPGLIIVEPKVFDDSRGYFFESYNQKDFEENEICYKWIQDNQSRSKQNVIRGLHFQRGEWAQTKLVRCLNGSILDVAVDLRKDSPTFKRYFSIELSSDNKKSLLIPIGFAHGFSILSESADVLYKCDNLYNKESEGSLIYNDPTLNIDWKIPLDRAIVSPKDLTHPTLEHLIF